MIREPLCDGRGDVGPELLEGDDVGARLVEQSCERRRIGVVEEEVGGEEAEHGGSVPTGVRSPVEPAMEIMSASSEAADHPMLEVDTGSRPRRAATGWWPSPAGVSGP